MVAAATPALSATADGNQKKPGFPGFIPPGANPQQVVAALAARPAPNVLAGTGLGLTAPAQAPAMFTDGLGPRPAPQPEPAKKMGWNDVPPLRAPDNARNIYANMGVDDLKSRANLTGVQSTPQAPAPQATGTWGLSGLVGSTNDIMPRTRTVMSQSGQSISNLVNNGQYGAAAGEAVRGAAAMFPAVGLDVIAPLAPMGQGMVNATHQYATGESPAVTQAAAPAKTSAPTPTPVSTQPPLRVQEQAAANAATIAAAPQRNASGALTNLGTGTDVGFGVTRYNIPGQSPLFTNKTGDSGAADNMALMNRGAPTAQNAAAMDNLVARSEKQISDGVKMLQHQDQVAAATAFREAQARQEQSRSFAERLNNPRSEESVAINNLQRQLKPNLGESPAAFAARTAAVQAQINAITGAESLSSAERQATNQLGFKRDELTAKQQLEQSNLGLKRQQVGNELATGEQSRDAKGMEIAASKQLQSLRDRFMSATGAEQEALGKQLLTMSGKDPKSSMKENFMVVGGGQEWDAQANSMRNVPQTLIDLRTGKPVGGDVGGAKAPTTAVDFLKKNPSKAQAFKDKYGYLPEGFKQ